MSVPIPLEIRVSLDRMKHSIVQSMIAHEGELRDHLERGIDAAIAGFDFDRVVQVEAARAIEKVVGDAMKNLIGWEMQRDIERQVRIIILRNLSADTSEGGARGY